MREMISFLFPLPFSLFPPVKGGDFGGLARGFSPLTAIGMTNLIRITRIN